MARTPLFHWLRKAALKARPPALADRRRFLKVSALAVAAAGLHACASTIDLDDERNRRGPHVVIVGAGLAGLTCAWNLLNKRVRVSMFDAAPRVGGRAFTKHDILHQGADVDLGGEFIDGGHEDIINLSRELGVELVDLRQDARVIEEAFFFDGKIYSEAGVVEALAPLLDILLKDAALVPEEPEEPLAAEFMLRRTQARKKLDGMSLAQYLDLRDIRGWLRKLIEVAYVGEYGMEADGQSALNMLALFGADAQAGKLELFGPEAECLKFKHGAQSLAVALHKKLQGKVELELDRRLTVVREDGAGYLLSFARDNAPTAQVGADAVVLALPFTMLREVDLRLELPPAKKRAITELGYGMAAKLCLGMKSAPWRAAGYSGGVISDLPFQMSWDNARMRGAAGLTFFVGGKAAIELGKGTPREQVDRLLPAFEKVFPGTSDAFNQHFTRMHWPSHPFTRAAYSCYKPGQWTEIAGREAEPVGNLFFAGEHCGGDYQGYMNGAVLSGRRAAQGVLAATGRG